LKILFDVLRRILPETFPGPEIDELTGRTFKWETIQNRRSKREYPPECFVRLGGGGSPTIVIRDLFLDAEEARAAAKAAARQDRTSPRARRSPEQAA